MFNYPLGALVDWWFHEARFIRTINNPLILAMLIESEDGIYLFMA
jgi:hypothetical protein